MKTKLTNKYELHQQLLVALADESKVAFILDLKSLDLLIDAVLSYGGIRQNAKLQIELFEGMQQLRKEVFGERGGE